MGGEAVKVLLLVQNGDARPKCAWTLPSNYRTAAVVEHVAAASASRRPFLEFDTHFAVASEADCWWLVEAESAEAARRVIREANPFANLRHTGFAATPGRILASGGRR